MTFKLVKKDEKSIPNVLCINRYIKPKIIIPTLLQSPSPAWKISILRFASGFFLVEGKLCRDGGSGSFFWPTWTAIFKPIFERLFGSDTNFSNCRPGWAGPLKTHGPWAIWAKFRAGPWPRTISRKLHQTENNDYHLILIKYLTSITYLGASEKVVFI